MTASQIEMLRQREQVGVSNDPTLRYFADVTLETRGIHTRQDGTQELRVGGSAIIPGEWSVPIYDWLGSYIERVEDDCIIHRHMDDVILLHQHDRNRILAREISGTLRLTISGGRVDYTASIVDSPMGRGIYASIDRGDLRYMSFLFTTQQDRWSFDSENDEVRRHLMEITVHEISIVDRGAYLSPFVELRSLPAEMRSQAVALAESRGLTVVATREDAENAKRKAEAAREDDNQEAIDDADEVPDPEAEDPSNDNGDSEGTQADGDGGERTSDGGSTTDSDGRKLAPEEYAAYYKRLMAPYRT